MPSLNTRTATWVLTLLTCAGRIAPLHSQSATDALARVVEESGISGSVIVTKGGATLLSAGYGLANRELGVANTPSTRFRIGSITKQFTAMGVLILQNRGKLSVEDRVGEYVTSVPASWQQLTIHQLLTHTSGIMHSWALPGFSETAMVPRTLDGTLERFFDEPLVFEPGQGMQYSGVGYFLLAKIIEVVSGHPYEVFLEQEIFAPFGMVDTGADRPEIVLANRASGYVRDQDGTIRNAPAIYMPILTGGGNLYSSVEDLSRWSRGLSERRLISADAYTAMYRPERQNYAYGWVIDEFAGRQTISHGGGVPGFNAYILRMPAEELCVVVLTNLTPGRARTVAEALATVVLQS